jgi:hypothetical protein
MHRLPLPDSEHGDLVAKLIAIMPKEIKQLIEDNCRQIVAREVKRGKVTGTCQFERSLNRKFGHAVNSLATLLLAPAWGQLSEQVFTHVIAGLLSGHSLCVRSDRARGHGPIFVKDTDTESVRYFPGDMIRFVIRKAFISAGYANQVIGVFHDLRPDLLQVARDAELHDQPFSEVIMRLRDFQSAWVNTVNPGLALSAISLATSNKSWRLGQRLLSRAPDEITTDQELAALVGRTAPAISKVKAAASWIWTEHTGPINKGVLFPLLNGVLKISKPAKR